MKKEQVYVEVRSEKQAKKLKKVLDMFGESYGGKTFELLNKFPACYLKSNSWIANIYESHISGTTKVSIKQLRNILAAEHLKKGDVVVVKGSSSSSEYVVKVGEAGLSESLKMFILNSEYYHKSVKGVNNGVYGNFIRYATNEERMLFEDVKNGVWLTYDGYDDFLSYSISDTKRFGFNISGEWFEYNDDEFNKKGYRRASLEHVEKALIREAIKRGYKAGNSICLEDNAVYTTSDVFVFLGGSNSLLLGSSTIFKDGVWAEFVKTELTVDEIEQKVIEYARSVDYDFEKVYEEVNMGDALVTDGEFMRAASHFPEGVEDFVRRILDKHVSHWELRNSYSKGAKIEFLNRISDHWEPATPPVWLPNVKYRISTDDKMSNDEMIAAIEVVHDIMIDSHGYDLSCTVLKNLRKITKQMK